METNKRLFTENREAEQTIDGISLEWQQSHGETLKQLEDTLADIIRGLEECEQIKANLLLNKASTEALIGLIKLKPTQP